MMTRKCVILLLFGLFLFSCKRDFKENSKALYKINLSQFQEYLIDTSIISSIEYIPLITENPIAGIDKIICTNNKFYIFDKISKSVFVFSLNGNLISRLDKVGQGPGEVMSMVDFAVDDLGYIYIADNKRKKVIKFTEMGDPIEQYDLYEHIINMSLIDNDLLCFYKTIKDGNINSIVSTYDIKEHNKRKLVLPRKDVDNIGMVNLSKNHLYKTDSHILFNNYFSSTIFSINKNGMVPYVETDADPINWDIQEELSSNPQKMLDENWKRILLFTNIYETKDYLTFEFMLGAPTKIFYSKTSKKEVFVQNVNDNRYFGMTSIYGVTDDMFISYMDPSCYGPDDDFWERLTTNPDIEIKGDKELLRKNMNNYNPVIILFSLKSF